MFQHDHFAFFQQPLNFPGSLLLLPALMFGGWIAIAVVGGAFSLIGSVIVLFSTQKTDI